MSDLAAALGKKVEPDYWSVPPVWKGETVFVVGGGPSILNFDIDRLKKYNCIAINNAVEIVPWAKFLFFHDKRWLDWNHEAVNRFAGTIVTASATKMPVVHHRMKKDRKIAINCKDPTCVGGIDSGTMGVNLAYHLGAKTIALVGFDMGFMEVLPNEPIPCNLGAYELLQLQTPKKIDGLDEPRTRALDPKVLKHWHKEHPIPPRGTNYVRFLAQYQHLVPTLQSHDVTLVTLTPTRIKIKKVKLGTITN